MRSHLPFRGGVTINVPTAAKDRSKTNCFPCIVLGIFVSVVSFVLYLLIFTVFGTSETQKLPSVPLVQSTIAYSPNPTQHPTQKQLPEIKTPRAQVPRAQPPHIHNNLHQTANCLRYAHLTGPREGFGHMFSQITLTYMYALEKNATMVIDKMKFISPGRHGLYEWLTELVDLRDIPDVRQIDRHRLTVYNEQLWHQHSHPLHTCDVFYISCDTCCNFFNRDTLFRPGHSYCYYSKPSMYQLARPFFLPRYKGTSPTKIPLLINARKRNSLDVVWHVRAGDITLSDNIQPHVVENIMTQLHTLFPGIQLTIFVISEVSIVNLPVIGNGSFSAYQPIFLSSLDPREALEHMIEASVLITSGSAFASVATLLKAKSTGISLQFLAKEKVSGVYDVYDHAVVNQNGTIIYPDQNALIERCTQLLRRHSISNDTTAATQNDNE